MRLPPIQRLRLLPFCLLLAVSLVKSQGTDTALVEAERKGWMAWQKPQKSFAQNTYDIVYNRCHWFIDPAVLHIRGAVTTWFKPQQAPFSSLEFDLSSALRVDSVVHHGLRLTFAHYSFHILKVSLPGPLLPGQLDSLTIYYQGVPAGSGMGSFAVGSHSNTPALWTLSEPYGARDWWPCKQDLADKIDSIDLVISCPQLYRVASIGLLASETVANGIRSSYWKSRYPIATYLVAIAATNYVVFTQTLSVPSGTLPVVNYVYPEYLASAQEEGKGILQIMHLLDSLLIPYPFSKEKYGHAQFGWGGGMEHQTMSFMYGLDFALMAHECAHHWFGDHVTCGSWQDIWLNEGFATYLEGLCTQRYSGAEAWLTWRTSKLRDITSRPDGSVFCDDTTQVGRIFNQRLSYFKGAYLLRMLRWKIGDQAFFAGLRNYLNDPALAGNFARTVALRRHLEQSSGEDLGDFFAQWYYGQGYPSYDVEWKQIGDQLRVKIDQQTSHSSVPFFAMPVPMRFSGGGRDTLLVFDHRAHNQIFTRLLPFTAEQAVFDPDLQLITKGNRIAALYDLPAGRPALSLWPNPAQTVLRITLSAEADRISSLDVADALGKTVLTVSSPLSLNTYDLDVSGLQGGVYVVKLQTGRNSYHSKFIKR